MVRSKELRTPIVAGNWKMNTTVSEAVKLVREMLPELEKIDKIEKVVCPPFISLVPIAYLLKDSSVQLGAQNIYFENKGAFTGEISPLMLVNVCDFVIIGHSERRQYFNESGEMISKKIAAALNAGLKPILCVGEKLADYEAGRTATIVTEQINSSLAGINDIKNVTIAYEPIWAIGTGKPATGKGANETIGLIRSRIGEMYGKDLADSMRILYGGSVTAANIAEFMSQPEIDGGLVGGASLKAAEFINIVKQTAQIRSSQYHG